MAVALWWLLVVGKWPMRCEELWRSLWNLLPRFFFPAATTETAGAEPSAGELSVLSVCVKYCEVEDKEDMSMSARSRGL
jgi:hypothetical protein